MKLFTLVLGAMLLLMAQSEACAEGSLFSGFELFQGIKLNGITIGATFSGWTDAPAQEIWVPFSQTTGGFVTGSVNYIGRAGFSKTVTIVGGQWSWLEADEHTTHSGPINGGTVTWPVNKNTAISGEGCGHGVAFFNASVFDKTSNTSGTFSGCLNDQLTFPPKIWGDLTLASAP